MPRYESAALREERANLHGQLSIERDLRLVAGRRCRDLGAALYELDPSKAADAIGKVGGAADRMGKALASGPKVQIEQFKRGIEVAFESIMGAAPRGSGAPG